MSRVRVWLRGGGGIAAGLLLVSAAVLAPGLGDTPAGAGVYSSLALQSHFQVELRGNGHGHGMSQYGAQGAAEQGLHYPQILRFYYPHTRLRELEPTRLRVLLSGTGAATTVAAQRGLHVTGISGTLPTAGVSRYRLVAARGRGIGLLARHGRHWRRVQSHLPATARIHRHGTIRVLLADGSSTAYHGAIVARRQTASGTGGLMTINSVPIDQYVAGVVPREMPASWDIAALRAQAVAARSYARYEADHATTTGYDICDTSSCQVYGGAAHYAADGSLLWSDDPAAVHGDENRYLVYRGSAIFAQFSASDGGWTVDGGQPYLVAHRDAYDNAASGDPYVDYTSVARSAGLASYFGLAKVTGLAIKQRDGHGAWGGRVVTARVIGLAANGNPKAVSTDGSNLQWALGVGTDWVRVVPDHSPTGALHSVRRAHHGRGLRITGWAVDTDHAGHSPQVRVRIDGKVAGIQHTHMRRPAIVRRYALHYDHPGFHVLYHARPGRHRACVSVLDSNGMPAAHLGCRAVRIHR